MRAHFAGLPRAGWIVAALSTASGCGSEDISGRPAPIELAPRHEGAPTTSHPDATPSTVTVPDAGSRAIPSSDDAATVDAGAIGDEPMGMGASFDPDDTRTASVPAGTVKLGWDQIDIGAEANFENPADKGNPGACPDPDAMVTKGTVDYRDGAYTLTGSGEGFIHGWDQGNLVYFKTKVHGDFTFTGKVDRFEMTNGKGLDGAAEALLNVREDLGYRQPTQSVIAGAPPSKSIFMSRYFWSGDPNNKWWHWPAWPATWPNPRPLLSWTRITRRGNAFAAYSSTDGQTWNVVKHNDTDKSHPDWYPFQLDKMPADVLIGIVCSARNDRNYAPMTKLPGKTADCRDPNSDHLRGSARCVFSHLTLSQP
jgi:hypothetical protein